MRSAFSAAANASIVCVSPCTSGSGRAMSLPTKTEERLKTRDQTLEPHHRIQPFDRAIHSAGHAIERIRQRDANGIEILE